MDYNSTRRIWTIGAIIISLGIIAMGWFLGISPALSQAAQADTQRAAAEAQNTVHEQEMAKLQRQFTDLPLLKEQLAVLRTSIPDSGELSTFLGQLHALELQNGVKVSLFTASNGQLYTPVKSMSPLVVTTDSRVSPSNFVPIQVGVSVEGTQPQVMSFIEGLQTGPRLYLVTDLNLVLDPTTGNFKAMIGGLVYVLLDKPATPATAATKVKTATSP